MSPETSGNVSTGSRGTLALCWIVYGIIRVIFAVWMLAFAGTATVMFGALAVILGILFKGQNVAFMVGLAFAVAASANFPPLLLSIVWRRFNTAGAVSSIVAGAVMLVDTDTPGYGVSLPLVFAIAGASALFVLLGVGMAVKARRRPVVTGREELAGDSGEVLADFSGEGWARVHGETWRVRSAQPLAQGQRVRVTRVDGLTLDVVPQAIEPQRSTA